jgi:deglycase
VMTASNGSSAGKSVAFLTSQQGIEDAELRRPWQAVKEAGATPVLLAPETGEVRTVDHDEEPAGTQQVDGTIDGANAADFAAVVIPGGTINADKLRVVPEAVEFVQQAVAHRVPVAAICHGPWLLVEAGLVNSRELTSYPSLRTDISNAGGWWLDKEVVVDDRDHWVLITSRNPGDLDAFDAAIVEQLSSS